LPVFCKLLLGSSESLVRLPLVVPLTLLALSSARAAPGVGTASAEQPPLVAAFERFARHHEIAGPVAGQLLISELNCTACHANADPILQPKLGPNLAAVGNRLDLDWAERFIADPAAVKPGTTMPDVLHERPQHQRAEIAAALRAYLGSLRQPLREVQGSGANPVPHEFWNLGDPEQGRILYHRVGCVACHQPDSDYETADLPASQTEQLLELLEPEELEQFGLASAARSGPVQPLGDLAAQYSLRSLTLFLLDPEAVRPGGRMPNFKLTAVEAADLATYLLRRSEPQRVRADFSQQAAASSETALIAEGRKWFAELRCANCHTGAGENSAPASVTLAQLTSAAPTGCLAPHEDAGGQVTTSGMPRYHLDADQRDRLVQALAANSATDAVAATADGQLRLKLLQLNCYACHQRDELGGVSRDRRAYFETVGGEDLGDEGRIPPPLSGVGRKARPAWLNRVLQGTGEIRPHMHARMPKFPAAAAKELGDWLLQVDRAAGVAQANGNATKPDSNWPAAVDEQQFQAGHRLMDAGCIQCHTFRGEALPGVIGVDLHGIGERVEPQWFREFVLNPGAVKPRTRMPSFFADGQSHNAELLGGDPDRQIAAMWGYLKSLSRQPLPAKIEEVRARDYELKPTERPILIRTFMRDAGPRAIAVGFPQQVHFALDADSLRLVSAWRGRFLDAQGTWFVRSAPPADPLGNELITICEQDLLLFARDAEAEPVRRFLGFEFDQQGVPTFSYEFGGLHVEDRITPDASPPSDRAAAPPGLRRLLRFKPQPVSRKSQASPFPLAIRLLSGQQLTQRGSGAMENERGLVVMIDETLAQFAELHTADGVTSWVLPLLQDPSNERGEAGARLSFKHAGKQPSGELDTLDLEVRYQW